MSYQEKTQIQAHYVSQLAWECIGVPLKEVEEVDGEREVWASLGPEPRLTAKIYIYINNWMVG